MKYHIDRYGKYVVFEKINYRKNPPERILFPVDFETIWKIIRKISKSHRD